MGGPPEAGAGGPPGLAGPPGAGAPGAAGGPPSAKPKPEAAGAADGRALAKEALNLKHAGKYDEAAEKAKAAIDAEPCNELAHWVLAWIYAEQGRTHNDNSKVSKAKKQFQCFLKLSKNAKKRREATRALKRLSKAG
ncbi:MAG: hypothetical protein H5T86_02995 [Armatimonadetes bacterium]|nr:hypothetical protein [Armatimonadota bacterium]